MMTSARLLPALLLACAGAAWWAPVAAAVEQHPSNPQHRGIVTVELYQIFPENRRGNSVYYNNHLALTLPNQIIRHIAPLPREGRFAYLTEDAEGKPQVGVLLQRQDGQAHVSKVTDGFYFVVVTLDGVVYKKLYRIVENSRLVDLLPQSKTVDGAVAGKAGVVFYHVASVAERGETSPEAVNEFGMRLHVALYDEEHVRDLEFPVLNALPRLTLAWSDPDQITYTLADGRQEVVSVSQFQ